MPYPPVVRLAWVNVALHAPALALAVLVLQPGTPPAAPAERAAFVAAHHASWSLAWGMWALCAMAHVAFLAAVAGLLEGQRGERTARLALITGAMGAAVDLTADALWASVLPELAAAGASALFLAVERTLAVAGQTTANGLYSVAVLLATWALTDGRPWRGPVGLTGSLTAIAGLTLSAVGLLGTVTLLRGSAGATIVSFMAWCLAIARLASRS